jgi:hypothetical protein
MIGFRTAFIGVILTAGCKLTVEDEITRVHRLSAPDGVTFASSVFFLKKEMSVHASWQLQSTVSFAKYVDRLLSSLPEYEIQRRDDDVVMFSRHLPGDVFLIRVKRSGASEISYVIDVTFTAFPS